MEHRQGAGGETSIISQPFWQPILVFTSVRGRSRKVLRRWTGVAQRLNSGSLLLDHAARLRSQEVPFLGNGWDVMISSLDATAPGMGQVVLESEALLKEVDSYTRALSAPPDFSAFEQSVRAFDATPSRITALHLQEVSAAHLEEIRSFQNKISRFQERASVVIDGIGQSRGALIQLSSKPSLLPLREGITILRQSLDTVTAPMEEFYRLNKETDELLNAQIRLASGIIGAAPSQGEPEDRRRRPRPSREGG